MSEIKQNNPVIRVGVIGFGFMGRTHALAYQSAQRAGYPCRLVTVADPALQTLNETPETVGNIGSKDQEFDGTGVTLLRDAQELIERSDIDLVSICTHTDSHVDLAIKALDAGKHVLVEKPIAINADDVQRLAAVANQSDCVCIPAMCMRFWPAWVKIKEIIDSMEFGTVRSAEFHRLGTRPNWASDFYSDDSRSGGVLHDLHIHDTDFIVHCFGMPKSVTTVGQGLHINTQYHYPQGTPQIQANAAWDRALEDGFVMRCTIVCEQATLDFDFSRDDQLIVYKGDDSTPVDVGNLTGYDAEIRHMLYRISGRTDSSVATMQSAWQVARVLEAERSSLIKGAIISI